MTKLFCSVPERFVNPLFEVFDGGDFVLSSYRDVESDLAEMRIFFEEGNPRPQLEQALETVGVQAEIFEQSIADEDWKFAYRRHFKTELVSPRILVQPEWEDLAVIKFDPGLAFGTGKHETTKASLQYIDELSSEMRGASFLDMGSGSGILSIAAAKLGYTSVRGFDIDIAAVESSIENAKKNEVNVDFIVSDLFDNVLGTYDIIVSNPPYIKTKVIEGLMPEVRRFEPMIALDGREDGLYFYNRIIDASLDYLKPNGHIFFEIGFDQAKDVAKLLIKNNFEDIRVIKDYVGHDRIVKARRG